jgi:hypothetical protein
MSGKSKKSKRSEVELGRPVIAWLERDGWDVYQEVQRSYGGAVADIVAKKGDLVAVVELKKSLTFDLLAQAHDWVRRGLAHHVFAAVPNARASDGRRMAERVFEDHGIGVLEVLETSYAEQLRQGTIADRVKTAVISKLLDAPHAADMRDKLRPEHKTHAAAGSARGGHYTEFKGTCERLRAFVEQNKGTTLNLAIANIVHHYSSTKSARAHLSQLIGKGIINGVRGERDDQGTVRLYPTELAA